MIKWYCNFNIPDSTIQLSEAFVIISNFKNVGETCKVSFNLITGDKVEIDGVPSDVVVKSYEKVFDRNFSNEEEIYIEELKSYDNAEVV